VPPAQQSVPLQQLFTLVPHTSWPAPQHVPDVQTFPPVQAVVQSPQCWASVVRSTQAPTPPGQSVGRATGHEQMPVRHSPLVGQTAQPAPQAVASVSWLTQRPGLVPQTSGAAPGQAQDAEAHVAPVGQAVVQPPQCSSSVWKLTQEVGQGSGRPVGQTHALETQMSLLSGQTWPQEEQFRASVVRSTQRGQSPGQGVAVPQSQTPPTQVPRPQGWLQAPQLAPFACVSTQVPPQSC
jgi:hypothetical protein